jgi:tetratricopeptide (TPR) repeat protein
MVRTHVLVIFLMALAIVSGGKEDLGEAEKLLSTRDFKGALAIYDGVLKASPGDTSALRGRAKVYSEMRDWPGAIAAWKDLLELLPHDAEGNVHRWLATVEDAGEDSVKLSAARERIETEALRPGRESKQKLFDSSRNWWTGREHILLSTMD